MATSHGKNAALSLDGTNLDTYTANTSLARNVATADTTGFGSDDQTLIAGLESGTLTASGSWDDATVDAALDGMLDGAAVAVVYGPEGRTTGDVEYTLNVIPTNITVSTSNGQAAQWSFIGAKTGAVTVGTFS